MYYVQNRIFKLPSKMSLWNWDENICFFYRFFYRIQPLILIGNRISLVGLIRIRIKQGSWFVPGSDPAPNIYGFIGNITSTQGIRSVFSTLIAIRILPGIRIHSPGLAREWKQHFRTDFALDCLSMLFDSQRIYLYVFARI